MPTQKSQLTYLIAYILVFTLNGIQRFIPDKEIAFLAPLVLYPIFCGWGAYLFKEELVRGWKRLSEYKLKAIGIVFGSYVADQCFTTLFVLLSMAVMHLLNLQNELSNDQNISRVMQLAPAFVTLPVLAFIGPMVEELIFRQVLQENMKKRLSVWLTLILQAILFGCIHVHRFELSEFVQVLPHMATGFLFGIIREKTDNIWFVILPHSLNNFLGLLYFL